MRVVFMGTPDFSVGTLRELAKAGHEIAGVISQPDKPKGRGKNLQPTPVKEVAVRENIPVLQPKKVRDPEVVEELRTFDADVIVVDPPRKGCEESLLRTMVEMEPERIVYVSCDSATLARDLKFLCGEGGYRLEKWRAVDQFPMTVHVETIVLIQKKNS